MKNNHFAHYYMTVEEYGLWNYARAVSAESKVLYLGHGIADQFDNVGIKTTYRVAKSLEKKGWFRLLQKSRRNKHGVFTSAQYYPLSMEEWAAIHPKRLRAICPPSTSTQTATGTSTENATGEPSTSTRLGVGQYPFGNPPVPKPQLNLKEKKLEEKKEEKSGEKSKTARLQSSNKSKETVSNLIRVCLKTDDRVSFNQSRSQLESIIHEHSLSQDPLLQVAAKLLENIQQESKPEYRLGKFGTELVSILPEAVLALQEVQTETTERQRNVDQCLEASHAEFLEKRRLEQQEEDAERGSGDPAGLFGTGGVQ
jgi:hypothetical protein